jgi:hypothetical protein
MPPDITVKSICQAFEIAPAGLYHLEARGYLPPRPRGELTPEYVSALADRLRLTRGSLPVAAERLLAEVHNGKDH